MSQVGDFSRGLLLASVWLAICHASHAITFGKDGMKFNELDADCGNLPEGQLVFYGRVFVPHGLLTSTAARYSTAAAAPTTHEQP